MTDGWFAGVDRDDVDAGFAADEADYHDRFREAAVEAASRGARDSQRADDRQLVHAVRAMDDMDRNGSGEIHRT